MVTAVLKADLHIHTGDDPVDRIPYSTLELIDRAAVLGYDVLAITLHDLQLHTRRSPRMPRCGASP